MDAGKVLREFLKVHKGASGIKTFLDAQLYAEDVGDEVVGAFGGIDFEETEADDLMQALLPVLKRAYGDSAKAAAMAQRIVDQKAGLGLAALEPDFDAAVVTDLAESLAGRSISKEFFANAIKKETVGAVDKTIQQNAEARQELGLQTHITREYSDRGLRSGTKYAEDCQWCLDRCGEWFDYQEAYKAGCFERHPGCVCIIDYQVGKTHTIGRDKYTWQNV